MRVKQAKSSTHAKKKKPSDEADFSKRPKKTTIEVLSEETTALLKALSGLKLCQDCAARQGLSQNYASRIAVPAARCQICQGILSEADSLAEEICNRLQSYEFDSFLVGARIPLPIIDREDEIRSELKIRGEENLKTQLTRMLGRKVAERTGKPVNFKRPDVTILLSTSDRSVTINSRSIWASAAYRKKVRGIPQRQTFCLTCNGLGCAECDYKGSKGISVESVAREFFKGIFHADNCNFNWLGSEDQQSLVLGEGRPFLAEIQGPRVRQVPKGVKLKLDGEVGVDVSLAKILPTKPISIPTFTIRCRAYLQLNEGAPPRMISKDIEKDFHDARVSVRLSRKAKIVSKKIETVKVDQDERNPSIEIQCDGGIPIKKLLSGDDGTVSPNLSSYLEGYSINPEKPFDILSVSIKGTKMVESPHVRRGPYHKLPREYTPTPAPSVLPSPPPPSSESEEEPLLIEN